MDIAKIEKDILATAIKSREHWETLCKLEVRKDLTPEGVRILDEVSEYYTKDKSINSASINLVETSILRKLTNPKHQELFKTYFQTLDTALAAASPVNLLQEISSLKRHAVGMRLASALVAGSSSESEVSKLLEEYQSFQIPGNLTASIPEYKTAWDIQELMESSFNKENLIKVLPKTFNERVGGGMMRGDHLVIMAPTEMGKSLFAVNLTYGFLVQGLKVLYCCNEEPSARTNLRVISRLAEMPKGELYDPTKWDEIRGILSKKGYGNFAITDLKPGTLSEIDELVMDFKADVVVVDQLRNLSMASESRTNQLEQAATGIRNIGKLRNVLPVSITQAGASAFGKTVLTRGDVDGSNVGIPGQADVLLGIGANEEMEVQGTRWISFPKNKNGDHTPFSVHFDTQLSKVTEI